MATYSVLMGGYSNILGTQLDRYQKIKPGAYLFAV